LDEKRLEAAYQKADGGSKEANPFLGLFDMHNRSASIMEDVDEAAQDRQARLADARAKQKEQRFGNFFEFQAEEGEEEDEYNHSVNSDGMMMINTCKRVRRF